MRVVVHPSPAAFLDRASGYLEQNEAENNLILGVMSNMHKTPSRLPEGAYMATVEDGDVIVGAAMMTPPRPIVVTRAPLPVLVALADDLDARAIALPGCNGVDRTSDAFSTLWCERHGKTRRIHMTMGAYQLDTIIEPEPPPGAMRMANGGDASTLSRWALGFFTDVGLENEADDGIVKRLTDAEQLFVWEHDGALESMAAHQGDTPNGARISLVYTPKEHRGKGLASATVAALCKRLLAAGKKFCFLFADSHNPTSNKIYRRIGFRYVCEFRLYAFE